MFQKNLANCRGVTTFAAEKVLKRPCRCDWETHQIQLNTEVASPIQWRATPAQVLGYYAGNLESVDYKGGRALKSCTSEFHRINQTGLFLFAPKRKRQLGMTTKELGIRILIYKSAVANSFRFCSA